MLADISVVVVLAAVYGSALALSVRASRRLRRPVWLAVLMGAAATAFGPFRLLLPVARTILVGTAPRR